MNMGREEGIEKGIEKGLAALVHTLKNFCDDFEMVYQHIITNEEYALVSREQVRKYY